MNGGKAISIMIVGGGVDREGAGDFFFEKMWKAVKYSVLENIFLPK